MKVVLFSEDELSSALSNHYTSQETIQEKNHFKYLVNYLKEGIAAKTIVIEEEYVSKDFLQDYSTKSLSENLKRIVIL